MFDLQSWVPFWNLLLLVGLKYSNGLEFSSGPYSWSLVCKMFSVELELLRSLHLGSGVVPVQVFSSKGAVGCWFAVVGGVSFLELV
ncbi:hypothetical protein L2E82_01310 [Cichorium intybus]|uniref:Uncharacterized protein n=1 Tax=Cichorium intybus TaxID=13427 RepID=A0ACB9GZ79_CICIN|nr:hypothetical protein L2E82_01310 [Cichorium intybus]